MCPSNYRLMNIDNKTYLDSKMILFNNPNVWISLLFLCSIPIFLEMTLAASTSTQLCDCHLLLLLSPFSTRSGPSLGGKIES